ncbi:hypothetical protein PoB_007026600, partial [Plakobranchus ocellatus]
EEIRLLAEAAGMTKQDVVELIENPPDAPNDVEDAILALAAAIMEADIAGKGSKKGQCTQLDRLFSLFYRGICGTMTNNPAP